MCRKLFTVVVISCIALLCGSLRAELLTPLSVSGFNIDGMWGPNVAPDATNGGGYLQQEPGPSPNIYNGGYRYALFAAGAVSDYNVALPGGLPVGNFTSAADATHTYCFAAAGGDSVASANMLRIDAVASGSANTGTLTLAAPGNFSSIGILADTWRVSTSYANLPLSCTLNFSDGTTQVASYDASTYLGTPTASATAVSATLGARDVAKGLFPTNDTLFGTYTVPGSAHIFESVIAIAPANQSKTLTSITFSGYVGAADRSTDIYAVSGSAVPEPGTLMLLAAGLVALAAYVHRRNK